MIDVKCNHVPVKIALVVPDLDGDGGVKAVARFIREIILSYEKYEITIISLAMSMRDSVSTSVSRPDTWMRGPRVERRIWDGHEYFHVGANFSEFEFQRYKPRKVLNQLLASCDLIQVVCGSPAWANAVASVGKPLSIQVATLAKVERRKRDFNPTTLQSLWRKLMTIVTDRIDNAVLKKADAIQVENRWMYQHACKQVAGLNVDVKHAPPGVNTSLFRPEGDDNRLNNPYILTVGRLSDPRKNVQLLLNTYLQLDDQVREKVFIILAGFCSPPNSFWNYAEQNGVIDRIKYIENPTLTELVNLYRQAALFALTSDEEGLGMVVLEAMSCGIPVIATKCGGPEDIISDGIDGYLVDLEDSVTFSERITRLVTDTELNVIMGKNARDTIMKRYDESITARAFLEAWSSLSGNTPG